MGVFGSYGRGDAGVGSNVLAREVQWLVEAWSPPQQQVAAPGAMKGEIEVAADFDEPIAEHFDALSVAPPCARERYVS